ncbi:hypothetical protein [Paenibacillus herberti]|uniref:Uncharacterized protein n=1 Tax=Paenibacillus herberti TaxID=1619309 RepID=A0A229NZI9_9BACL|nr:hypothetical protein [Paenibacillus herberti]OXM15446.1 hypothetical protein CGZ75_01515 [Paenibacillus herberti]
MKEIILNPYFPGGRPSKAYLVEEGVAIGSSQGLVYLSQVQKTETAGVYVPIESHNFIIVSPGGKSISALGKIVAKLKAMDAYTLITRHYDVQETVFNVCGNPRGFL